LPAPEFGRARRAAAQGTYLARLPRSRTQPVLLDHHHGVCPLAAVHHARAGRADLRADGRYLFVRSGRGVTLGPDPLAHALHDLLPAPQAGPGQLPGPRTEEVLPVAIGALPQLPLASPRPGRAADC